MMCARCGMRPREKGIKYCLACKSEVMYEIRRSRIGIEPRPSAPRSGIRREDTRGTKFGKDQG
jgi:hypothetical protein